MTLHNAIVAGNSAGLSGSQDLFNFSAADFNPSVSSYNLIGISNGSGLTNGTNGNQVGSTASPKDPKLAPLGDYGGPTQTHALLMGSPAIDAGNLSAVAGQNGVPLFDQRGDGFSRVVDGNNLAGARLDIGAIEFHSTPIINGIAEAYGTDSADTITLTDSTLTINGGSYDVSLATTIVVYGLIGNDVINASTATKPVRIYGGDGADTITGGAGSDFLYGGEGNDDILAGQGDDQLSGDAGNDKLQGNAGNDRLEGGLGDDELGVFGIIGGEGDDTYVYSGTQSLGYDSLFESSGIDTFDFSGLDYGIGVQVARGADEVEVSHNGKLLTIDLTYANFLIENVIGTIYDDQFTGTNVVTQEDSTYAGGAGNDTYFFKGTDIAIVELPGEGTDTIDFSQLSTVIGVTVSLYSNAPQQVWGSSNLTLVNPLGLENVIGTTKNDVLTGNASDNYLAGGLGNDAYKIAGDTDQGRDTIFDAIGLGTDTIDFSGLDFGSGVTFDLREIGSNYEVIDENGKKVVLDLTSAALENVTGTRFDDTLTGSTGNNVINGGPGDDWLQGREGTDTLNGGTGNDTYNLIAGQTLSTDVVNDADGFSIQFPNGTTSSRPFIDMSPQFELLGKIVATDDGTATIATISDVESAIGNLDIDVTGIDGADITILPTGEIVWSPDEPEVGSDYQVTISVTDQELLTNMITFTASVVADVDSDGDGLDDLNELNDIGSDPYKFDTDNDQLPDGFEHASNVLDPLIPDDPNGDHDADGLPNIGEFEIGTNPDVWDTDGNGLNDLDGSDFDDDGLNHLIETTLGTDPHKFDSDLDLLSDGFEVEYDLDPLDDDENENGRIDSEDDFDGDGLSNLSEQIHGTGPTSDDTDGDGATDLDEAEQGSDPKDPTDLGAAPPEDELVDLTLLVGDFSGSQSERWDLIVGPVAHQATEYGRVESDDYRLRKGKTHELKIVHRGTRPDYIGHEGFPDYDYSAEISPAAGETDLIIIEDPDDILRTGWYAGGNPALGGPNYAEGKTAKLHLPLVDLDFALPSFLDAQEQNPGGYLLVNNDDDNDNGMPDFMDPTVVGDNDLLELKLSSLLPESLHDLPGTFVLSFAASHLRLWKDAMPIVSGITQFDKSIDHTIFIEAILASAGEHDLSIEAKYTPGALGPDFQVIGTDARDTIQVTAISFDLYAKGNPTYFAPGKVRNLLGVWPGDPITIEARLTPNIPNPLPANFLTWSMTSLVAPAPNTTEHNFVRANSGLETISVALSGTVGGFSLQMTKKAHVDYPDVGTLSETPGLLTLDPSLYAVAGAYGLIASAYAQNLIDNGMSAADANAIQHAYWNALIASEDQWTTADALLATTAHEYDNRYDDGGGAFDTTADLHNNFVGANTVHTTPEGLPDFDIIKTDLMAKLASGALWRVDAFANQVEKTNGKPIYGQ